MNAPLVSLIVITYNSSPFVVETLESAKAQTYPNIELIICDDCSTDATAAVCGDWLRDNGSRFARALLLTAPGNTGVAGNLNRGIKEARGEWIKGIAGDDTLKSTCLSTYIEFISTNKNIRFVHAAADIYAEHFRPDCFISHSNAYYETMHNNHTSPENQFQILLTRAHILAPTTFIKKDVFDQVGLYDESIPMLEDWPMWLRISRQGIQMHYLDTCTINYRIHSASITNQKGKTVQYKEHTFDIFAVYKKYIRQHLSPIHRMINDHIIFYTHFSFILFHNKRNLFTRGFHFLIIKPAYALNNWYNERIISRALSVAPGPVL